MKKIGRNDLCPCGSGKKHKKCCMDKDLEERHVQHAPDTDSDEEDAPLALPLSDDMAIDESENWDESFWENYIMADFDEKTAMIDGLCQTPSFDDADLVFEVFNELNDETGTPERRTAFASMVRLLKETHRDLYEHEAGYLLDYCVSHAVIDRKEDELRSFFMEYAEYAATVLDTFSPTADCVAYYGYLDVLRDGFRIGWEKVRDADDLLDWGIVEYGERAMNFELLYYLEHTENPHADAARQPARRG